MLGLKCEAEATLSSHAVIFLTQVGPAKITDGVLMIERHKEAAVG
jgi:hypothetical protein